MSTASGYTRSSTRYVSAWDKEKLHMKNVYTALAGTMLAAALGGYLSLTSDILYGSHMLTAFGSLGKCMCIF